MTASVLLATCQYHLTFCPEECAITSGIPTPLTSPIVIRPIRTVDTLRLRREVLRPDLEFMLFEGDDLESSLHLGAFVDERLVGVITIIRESLGDVAAKEEPQNHHPVPPENYVWRIRGLAVDASMRSRGCGTRLIETAMRCAEERGGRMIWCVARCTAELVYKRQGFRRTGDVFYVDNVGLMCHMFRPLSTVF